MNGKAARARVFYPWVCTAMAALGLWTGAVWAGENTFVLKEAALVGTPGHAFLKLSFSGSGADGEYPMYFQMADSSKGTVTLSFLETETAFPLGRHSLPASSPAVDELQLRKITSPSGKNFLGVEIKLKSMPSGDLIVEPNPKGILKVTVGAGVKKKSTWLLSAAVKSKEDYLSAKAEPPPVLPVASAPSASVPPASVPVQEIPTAPPVTAPETKQVAPNAPAGTANGEAQAGNELPAKESGPTKPISDPQPGSERAAMQGTEPPSPIKSAQAEGAALDARHVAVAGKGAGLSSSKIFSVGGAGKTMVFLRDSTALLDAPGPKGKPGRKIAMGAKIDKLESKGGWLRVALGQDTGYIKAGTAVYADEMTPATEKSLQAKQEALVKTQAAKEARAAAALATADAKQKQAERRAEMAAQLKAQRDSVKAAAQAAKLAAKAAKDSARATAKASKDSATAAVKLAAAKAKADKLALHQVQAQAPDQVPVEGASVQSTGGAPSPGGSGASGQVGGSGAPKLAIADNPELADKLAREKQQAENEKLRVEPEENRVTYNSYGRRDPFIPVEQGASDSGIDIDQMKVVGIIWQGAEPLAVLEHNREAGVSFTVKQGDPVHNGRVARITRDAVTFDISEYGISRSYSLKLVSNKVEGAKK